MFLVAVTFGGRKGFLYPILLSWTVVFHYTFDPWNQPGSWEKGILITHIPPFFVICSNSYTRILDRCSHSCASVTIRVVEGIWYDISWTQQELYPLWRLAQLGILHKCCACTTFQPHSIGGLWVEQQQWCFLLSSLSRHVILLRIHGPVKDRYWSNHPTSLLVFEDHCAGIQLAMKLTYSLYLDDLP